MDFFRDDKNFLISPQNIRFKITAQNNYNNDYDINPLYK
jgi:hypothetical protein